MASAPQCKGVVVTRKSRYGSETRQCSKRVMASGDSEFCSQHDPDQKERRAAERLDSRLASTSFGKDEARRELLWILGLLRGSFKGTYNLGSSTIAIEKIDRAIEITGRL